MEYTVVLNPAAGHGQAAKKRRALAAALGAAGLGFELVCTERPGHGVELARQAAAAGRVVVAAGGDGTIQEVCRGIVASGHPAHLGVLPLGTGNDFVKMLHLPCALGAAVQALATARPLRVDYGLIRWREDGASFERLFINVAGIGFDAQTADAVEAFKVLPGRLAYLAAALRTLRRRAAPLVEITAETDGRAEHARTVPLFLVTAGNGSCSGGGFFLTPEASIVDGKLDLCIIEDLPLRRVFQLIPRAVRGRHVGAPEVRMLRVARAGVVSSAGLPIHADGEVLSRRAQQVEIEAVPGGLSVLAPAPPAGRVNGTG